MSAAKSPGVLLGVANSPQWGSKVIMAANDENAVVTFNIFGPDLGDIGTDYIDNLTEDEKKEMENIVTLLDSVPENSLDDFEPDTSATRHKVVTDAELDRLAGKNSAQSTLYQTKWAVVVMKAKYC